MVSVLAPCSEYIRSSKSLRGRQRREKIHQIQACGQQQEIATKETKSRHLEFKEEKEINYERKKEKNRNFNSTAVQI